MLALPLAAISLQEAPAAVVVKVTGEAQVKSGENAPVAAAVGTRLAEGDQLLPAGGAEVIVVSRSGRKQTVTEAVAITAPQGADRGDMFTRTVSVLAQAATSDARSVPNRQGMIRPIPGEPGQVSPKNGIKVKPAQPITFTWFRVEGATGYMIQIRRAGAPPMRYEANDTTFTVPAADIEPGHTYYWTVGAGRRVAREDSVWVAGVNEVEQLDATLSAITEAGFDLQDDGQLLALIAHTDFGFHYDAFGIIEDLESTGTPLSADALLLKGELLDEMGRLDEARAAFDAADRRLRN